MFTLYGVAVSPENARHIVASLFADGSPEAMSAAAMIQKGVERDLYGVGLEPAERDAILSVLEDPPEGLAQSARRAGAGSPRAHVAGESSSESTLAQVRAPPPVGRGLASRSFTALEAFF